jgi:predicted secreted protein
MGATLRSHDEAMRRSKVPICLLLLLLLAGACGDDDLTDYGGDGDRDVNGDPVAEEGETTTLDAEETEAQVAVGDTVVVELEENPSVGDQWQLREEPDGDVLDLEDESIEIEDDCDGCGGTKQFTFTAVGEGETTFVLFNCYRCSSEGEPSEEPPPPAEIEFTVEVAS